jgi:hypothetical protein
MNIYLLISPVVWAALFLAGKMVPEKRVSLPLVVFESWALSVLAIAFFILNSAQELWRNTFYYDWTIIWPSYAFILANIPVQLIFYRAFKKKLLSTDPFIPVVKHHRGQLFQLRTNQGLNRRSDLDSDQFTLANLDTSRVRKASGGAANCIYWQDSASSCLSDRAGGRKDADRRLIQSTLSSGL